jgi:hypothetical protein
MSQSKFTPPKVGCQHFFSSVKSIRSESNTLLSGIQDIADNIYGISKASKMTDIKCNITLEFNTLYHTLHKITISDNIPHGFKNIFEQGINNPLNMGHIRTGHSDDNESSEFGTGLKKAIIYIAEKAYITTLAIPDNSEQKAVRVAFDIPTMLNRREAHESYEPTEFEITTMEQYHKDHPFPCGSTLKLENLNESDYSYNQETGARLTEDQFVESLISKLSKSYSDLIRDDVFAISLNDKLVPVCLDLTNQDIIPLSNQRRYRFYVKLNKKNDAEKICRIGLTPTGRTQYTEYDPVECKFTKKSPEDIKEFKNESDVFELDMISLSTKYTDHSHILNYDYTDIVRGGRCYEPPMKITKQESDGYSNHIYNKIKYESKRLNKVLGVGPNKRVSKPSNILISAIHVTQKESTSKWRAFCKNGNDVVFDDTDSDDSSSKKKGKKSKTTKSGSSKSDVTSTTATPSNSTTATPSNSTTATPSNSTTATPSNSTTATPSNSTTVNQSESNTVTPLESTTATPSESTTATPSESTTANLSESIVNETTTLTDDLVSTTTPTVIQQVSNEETNTSTSENHINLSIEEINTTSTDTIAVSIEKIKEAARKLMDLISDENFDRTDGNRVLEFVEQYVANK